MKSRIIIIFLVIFSMTECQSKKTDSMDYSTVKELNLERYMGRWYEIARYDHSFERGLVGVTATYSLRPDGKITVINQGYKDSFEGSLNVAKGKGKQPDPKEPGKLKVSFFLFFYADYYLLELDDDYNWALVGSSSDKYLWILSRTPRMAEDTLQHILGLAKGRGYDVNDLIMVDQKAS